MTMRKTLLLLTFIAIASTTFAGIPTVGLNFDGTEYSCVDLGPGSEIEDLQNPTELTVETWVKYNTTPSGCANYILSNESSENGGWSLRFETGIEVCIGGVSEEGFNNWIKCSSAIVPETDTWYHVAFTYDATNLTMTLFLDGVCVSTVTLAGRMNPSTQTLNIGEGALWKNRRLNGTLSDVRIWKTIRTDKEIVDDMNNTLTGTESGLLINWKMNEGSGNSIKDATDILNFEKTDEISWFIDPVVDPIKNPGITTVVPRVISGNTFILPIKVVDILPTDSIVSYQFKMNYDDKSLEYIDYSKNGTKSQNGTVEVNKLVSGQLNIAYIGTQHLSEGTLLNLQFKALKSGETTPIIYDFLMNTDTMNVKNNIITISPKYGDVDENNQIQAFDAAVVLQYSVGLNPIPSIDTTPWSDFRFDIADVDNNDQLTSNDASLILLKSIDLIRTFPVENEINISTRSKSAQLTDVTITQEAENLVFKAFGNLMGLNVTIEDEFTTLGLPEVLDKSMLKATNIDLNNYKIGLATTKSPAEGSTFMTIPIKNASVSEITFKLFINDTEKVVKANIKTGITTLMEEKIRIYPNPVKDFLTIDFGNRSSENLTIRIVNILGQIVYTSSINNSIMSFQLEGILNTGMYTLQVIDEQKNCIYFTKIVKK